MLLRKAGTSTDRANAALSSLQRTANAMGMLRSRIEARIDGVPGAESADLKRVLDLVKNAQLLLKEMSAKAESARFLEEFIRIISGASASVGEIQGEVRELVPLAEQALAEMHNAISDVSVALAPAKGELDASIYARASEEIASAQLQTSLVPETKVNAKSTKESAQEEREERLAEVAI